MYEKLKARDKRTARVVRALAESALRLLEQTGWDGLTVSRICDEADVARSTFYLHFRSPEEVIYEGLRTAYVAEFPEIDSLLVRGKPLSYPFFAHLATHKSIYRTIFSDDRGAIVVMRIQQDAAAASKAQHAGLREMSDHHPDPDLTASYIAGALTASGAHWILTNTEKSALEMAYWFSSMVAPGLLDLMGLSTIVSEE
jgi:AcrR family transcriptional regulator